MLRWRWHDYAGPLWQRGFTQNSRCVQAAVDGHIGLRGVCASSDALGGGRRGSKLGNSLSGEQVSAGGGSASRRSGKHRSIWRPPQGRTAGTSSDTFFNLDGSPEPALPLFAQSDRMEITLGACEYGPRPDGCSQYLLDHGVAVSEVLPRPHRQTGLHWAAYGGHADTVKVLLKRRPALDVRDGTFNGTPLDWALHGWRERRWR
jgi:hypothetical protein